MIYVRDNKKTGACLESGINRTSNLIEKASQVAKIDNKISKIITIDIFCAGLSAKR
tara:strand:- start:460 stop:627 length:168 start_codon:yes stop_codon:yes gene_type:complete